MKKITSFLSVFLLICVVGLAVCGIMLDWFTTEDTPVKATCTEQGYTLHRGWFGRETKRDITAPLGHRYTADTAAPTCTAGGISHYVCTDCGHAYDGAPTEPTGHRYVATPVARTC